MLSPNAKFSLQIGNWAPNLEFGDPKMKLGTRILVWEEQRPIGRTKTKSGRRNCRCPRNSRIRNNSVNGGHNFTIEDYKSQMQWKNKAVAAKTWLRDQINKSEDENEAAGSRPRNCRQTG